MNGKLIHQTDLECSNTTGIGYKSILPFFRSQQKWTRDITADEIATTLSHWAIWKDIEATNKPFGIIMNEGTLSLYHQYNHYRHP